MLGTEPQLVADYVTTGRVKIVFWPVLNHGNPSVYSTLAAECAGQQDPALFWAAHGVLFEKQDELWSADRDYYVTLVESLGADSAAFEACYDGGEGLAQVMALNDARLQRGIFGQPTFDVEGQVFAGLQRYEVFQAAIDAALSSP
ncbi:MAG: thioredoxin domain-containing protein [Anaerolineae bacterium]|nr:thioredoxin domain-containing protein [Anaerolineales bacterium]MCB8934435.1 thioredoxin domain-containing protein [Promineifilum sp.]MCO5181720.1 DsbA family protein [Promineifilum sp.]MCW5848250.1 thioredoxin domain-containing protein [Anaerolineae bacterium]